MRAAPLTAIQAGIDRQRVKGGARADSLYDLVNAYVNKANSVVVRPGTERGATLDPLTRGLVSFKDKLWTFCHQHVDVPYGFELGVLVSPDSGVVITVPGAPDTPVTATFDVTNAGRGSDPGHVVSATGADIIGYISTPSVPYGTLTGNQVSADMYVRAVYAVGAYATPNSQTAIALCLNEGTPDSTIGPASETAFDTLTFTDASSVLQTLTRASANIPTGFVSGGSRLWSWTLSSSTKIALAGNYTFTLDFTIPGTAAVMGAYEAKLEKIHFAEPFMGAPYVVAEFDNGGVYHYWLQPGERWEAGKAYKAGDLVHPTVPNGLVYRASRSGDANPPWAPNVPRYDGTGPEAASVVEPTVYNDFFYTCTAVTGASPRSGTTEPAWPTEAGAVIIESTDNPPDVIIPTSTSLPGSAVVPSTTQDRYGTFTNRLVTR